jgi:hypothetical protein
MSRWAEEFAALSRGVDTSRQSESTKPDVSQSVVSVTAVVGPETMPPLPVDEVSLIGQVRRDQFTATAVS